ncbi:MAG: hypothetical protein PUB20_05675 [Clostridia bacterium]|nr:hypothetical protein [Clostridia bacterium]
MNAFFTDAHTVATLLRFVTFPLSVTKPQPTTKNLPASAAFAVGADDSDYQSYYDAIMNQGTTCAPESDTVKRADTPTDTTLMVIINITQ